MSRFLPLLLIFGLTLLVACNRPQPVATPAEPEDIGSETPPPSNPDSSVVPNLSPAVRNPRGFQGTVIQTTDAGTLLIRPAGEQKLVTVRLIGLNAPVKATRDKDGQEPWATRGQQALAVLLIRKDVRVEFDVLRFELGQASVWAYVWLKGMDTELLVNEFVLAEGHAVLDTRVPNIKFVERLTAAQRIAREAGKNIWNTLEPLPESPSEYAKKAAEVKPVAATLAKWEEGCMIGNKSTKKYHVPSGQYYSAAKASVNAVFFKTEEDARNAGFEKSAR